MEAERKGIPMENRFFPVFKGLCLPGSVRNPFGGSDQFEYDVDIAEMAGAAVVFLYVAAGKLAPPDDVVPAV